MFFGISLTEINMREKKKKEVDYKELTELYNYLRP